MNRKESHRYILKVQHSVSEKFWTLRGPNPLMQIFYEDGAVVTKHVRVARVDGPCVNRGDVEGRGREKIGSSDMTVLGE